MDRARHNLLQALALLDGLAATGVRRVVASPGSRSTPLVLAAQRHPDLDLDMVLDERGAAWFALGQALATGIPSALLSTSGTAVAEWLPAVVEADLARVPLILISADRPPELVGRGANQTLDQGHLFGPRVRAFHALPVPGEVAPAAVRALGTQAAAEALGPLPGPVHLDQPFREPLVPGDAPIAWRPGPAVGLGLGRASPEAETLDTLVDLMSARPGLILCGPALGGRLPAAHIARLAEAVGAPILADPLSGLRRGEHDLAQVLSRQDLFLRRAHPPEPAWVLRLGGTPVSRVLGEYLATRPRAAQILVDPHGRWQDPWHRVDHYLLADPGALCEALTPRLRPAGGAWLRTWQGFDTPPPPPLAFEARLITTLGEHLPPGARLFSGNSLAIRLLDAFLTPGPKPLHLYCNRGASGIDGNLATLAGIAAARPGPTLGLVGDLSLFHDAGSLALLARQDCLVLVLDNGGGGIFGLLPQARLDEYETLFLTPQGVDLAHLAHAYGLAYRRLEEDGDLEAALAGALKAQGPRILHIRVDPHLSLARLRRCGWG